MSFEKAPAAWKLSDGSELPARVYFENAVFTAETRTFKGSIGFGGKTLFGDASREYTMVFSQDFSHIESGTVVKMDPDGAERESTEFGMDKSLKYKIHKE